jgi:hypothetical protein
MLTVGGVDVINDPAHRFAVPLDSISVEEAAPGSVSSIRFHIEDYALRVQINPGDEVRFFNVTTGRPIFLGYVQAYTVSPAFGEQGRLFDVGGTGIEAVLDWAILPGTLTFGANTNLASAIQSVVAGATGLGEIRAVTGSGPSSQAAPMGGNTPNLIGAVTIPAGTSVRQAIATLIGACPAPLIGA